MDKGKIKIATMMAMMYGMAGMASSSNLPTRREVILSKKPIKQVIPKGCCEFHFTKCGTHVSSTGTYIYYSCIASSKKVAIEKFNKYCLKNPPLW